MEHILYERTFQFVYTPKLDAFALLPHPEIFASAVHSRNTLLGCVLGSPKLLGVFDRLFDTWRGAGGNYVDNHTAADDRKFFVHYAKASQWTGNDNPVLADAETAHVVACALYVFLVGLENCGTRVDVCANYVINNDDVTKAMINTITARGSILATAAPKDLLTEFFKRTIQSLSDHHVVYTQPQWCASQQRFLRLAERIPIATDRDFVRYGDFRTKQPVDASTNATAFGWILLTEQLDKLLSPAQTAAIDAIWVDSQFYPQAPWFVPFIRRQTRDAITSGAFVEQVAVIRTWALTTLYNGPPDPGIGLFITAFAAEYRGHPCLHKYATTPNLSDTMGVDDIVHRHHYVEQHHSNDVVALRSRENYVRGITALATHPLVVYLPSASAQRWEAVARIEYPRVLVYSHESPEPHVVPNATALADIILNDCAPCFLAVDTWHRTWPLTLPTVSVPEEYASKVESPPMQTLRQRAMTHHSRNTVDAYIKMLLLRLRPQLFPRDLQNHMLLLGDDLTPWHMTVEEAKTVFLGTSTPSSTTLPPSMPLLECETSSSTMPLSWGCALLGGRPKRAPLDPLIAFPGPRVFVNPQPAIINNIINDIGARMRKTLESAQPTSESVATASAVHFKVQQWIGRAQEVLDAINEPEFTGPSVAAAIAHSAMYAQDSSAWPSVLPALLRTIHYLTLDTRVRRRVLDCFQLGYENPIMPAMAERDAELCAYQAWIRRTWCVTGRMFEGAPGPFRVWCWLAFIKNSRDILNMQHVLDGFRRHWSAMMASRIGARRMYAIPQDSIKNSLWKYTGGAHATLVERKELRVTDDRASWTVEIPSTVSRSTTTFVVPQESTHAGSILYRDAVRWAALWKSKDNKERLSAIYAHFPEMDLRDRAMELARAQKNAKNAEFIIYELVEKSPALASKALVLFSQLERVEIAE